MTDVIVYSSNQYLACCKPNWLTLLWKLGLYHFSSSDNNFKWYFNSMVGSHHKNPNSACLCTIRIWSTWCAWIEQQSSFWVVQIWPCWKRASPSWKGGGGPWSIWIIVVSGISAVLYDGYYPCSLHVDSYVANNTEAGNMVSAMRGNGTNNTCYRCQKVKADFCPSHVIPQMKSTTNVSAVDIYQCWYPGKVKSFCKLRT